MRARTPVESAEPSPYAFGCEYARKVIASTSSGTLLADQLVAIIRNTDFNVLGVVLEMALEPTGNAKSQQILKTAIKSVVSRCHNLPGFRKVVMDFLNSKPAFPLAFFNQIPKDAAFILAVYGCSSKYEQ